MTKSQMKIIRHGESKKGKWAREYKSYSEMKGRCLNKTHPRYSYYGGRGIGICDRWIGRYGYVNFLADMGRKPSLQHSLDRIDNDGGYWCGKSECPECGPLGRKPNCRWATRHEQNKNTRKTNKITWRGETLALCDWAARFKINKMTLWSRLRTYGWSVERAMTTPSQGRGKTCPESSASRRRSASSSGSPSGRHGRRCSRSTKSS